jgi:ATP-dependent DNA helicase RecG
MGPELHWFPEEAPLNQLAATLVGMANSAGGTIFLGIAPRSGHVLGVKNVDAAIDRVFQAALLAEPPLLLPVPQVFTIGSFVIVQVLVPPGLPHVYRLGGRYLWREGRQNDPIPPRRLRQLLLERGEVQFETRSLPDASLEDLDLEQVMDYVQTYQAATRPDNPNQQASWKEILLQRGCLKRTADGLQPTYAALLLFNRTPHRWLPSATILAARFSGVAFADRFIKLHIEGSLPQQLHQAENFVRANLQSVVRLIGLRRQETLEYPFDAVRELLVNAVAHRDYTLQGDPIHLNIFSDRLEVISPGGLPGPVNLDNLLEARFSRNAVIVQVLSDLGFVERLGFGLDRVVTLMSQNGLQPPRFDEVAGTFKVTLFNEPTGEETFPDLSRFRDMDLNPRQEMALNHLVSHRRISNSDLQALCPDVHPESLRRDLADLVSRGVLIKIGDKRATYYILK